MERAKYTLQDHISIFDTEWRYTVTNLPKPETCHQARLIKALTLVCSSSAQGLYLRWTPFVPNRATQEHALDHLILVSIADFRPLYESQDPSSPSNHKQTIEYLVKFLSTGIVINGVRYSFFGHSNSQLKSRSCYFLAGSKKEVGNIVEALGDFGKIKTAAKKAKRIGLLFSTANFVCEVSDARYQDIDDIERDGFIFTDGCGLASKDFVAFFASKKPIIYRDRRYHPSVLQIRYKGYKGVVTIEPQMPKGIWLKFRKSMKKFSGTSDLSFAVVEHSKPYTYGYLNDEIVLLLHSLGIETAVFAEKQRQYFEFLEQSRTDARFAFRLLSSLGFTSEAEQLLINGTGKADSTVRKVLAQEYSKMINKKSEQKTRILIPKSRLLFGICDPYGLLKPNECFLRVTYEATGSATTIAETNVLVSRNPCLHPGDLRKLKAVNIPQLSHLTDCIVFSTMGKRPTADLMSGGDLDGDTFFVCWDPQLVPGTLTEPAEYPGVKEAIRFSTIMRDDLVAYFAGYNSMSLGRVKKLYLAWARAKGPHSSQCQELNRLFSQCVDGNKIKIPRHFEQDPPDPSSLAEPFILDTLHDLALDYCRKVKASSDNANIMRGPLSLLNIAEGADREMMEFILSNPSVFSDFELAKLTLNWCRKNHVPFEEFWTYFDPSRFSVDEQAWILSELPPSAKYASYVKNGLLQSNILTREDLETFRLDFHSFHWKCVFDSTSDPLRKLMAMVNQTFSQFAKKLLILRLGERLSIAIYFPRPLEKEEDSVVHATVRLFAFPHSHKDKVGHRRAVPTKKNYRFYYDDTMMQLYENHRSNTFVYFGTPGENDLSYRGVEGKNNRARARQETIDAGINSDWIVSVALQKFSAQLATQIGRTKGTPVTEAELYVISNKDVSALRALDLLLESVDTVDVLPNFPDEPPEDSFSRASDIDWDQHSKFVGKVVRDKNYSLLPETTIPQLQEVLQIAWKYDLDEVISETYKRLLHYNAAGGRFQETPPDIVNTLVDFLHFRPSMAIHFARLCPWSLQSAQYSACLQRQAIPILHALILCANRMGELVLKHICDILQEGISLTLSAAQRFLEDVSLSVTDPDLVLTILMECRGALALAVTDHDSDDVTLFLRNMFGIVLDHCAETSEMQRTKSGSWKFTSMADADGKVSCLTSQRRIDAPRVNRLAVGDHVRFVAKVEPPDSCAVQPTAFDAIVESAFDNVFKFQCFCQPPAWVEKVPFEMRSCVPFVTSRTMGEALVDLLVKRDACCGIAGLLLTSTTVEMAVSTVEAETQGHGIDLIKGLNSSQSRAVQTSLTGALTCLWGPPGTGKTTTIVALLRQLLKQSETDRVLVTAPTHNAVDNVLRQYVKKALASDGTLPQPVRVSTELMKVSDDLKAYTCDAMFGKDLNQYPAVRRKAVARISESRLIFTTCVGSALGLLKKQSFETVIIDEASQQTEPASFIPLVKGCQRAIFVGDHVQLRATVSPHAAALDFDVSLMERLWTNAGNANNIGKVMLDTQYRMHPDLCHFPSTEFYDGRLLTAVDVCGSIQLPASNFPWPKEPVATSSRNGAKHPTRSIFIQCSHPEEYFNKSKANQIQANLCKDVLKLLTSTTPLPSSEAAARSKAPDRPSPPPSSIAILTPYSRQADLLRQTCGSSTSGITIASIDGFQGQEADIVIFVTVRCNVHREIGFLKDMRRLNVALTRAKAGLIIIGDENTLTSKGASAGSKGIAQGGKQSSKGHVPAQIEDARDLEQSQGEGEGDQAYRVWDRLIRSCAKVKMDAVQSCLDAVK